MCQSIMLCTVLSVNYISIKLGKKRKEWKRVGTWPSSSGLGPTEQQGGLAGTELTKDLGGT